MTPASVILIALILITLVIIGVVYRYMTPGGAEEQLSILSGSHRPEFGDDSDRPRRSPEKAGNVSVDDIIKRSAGAEDTKKKDDIELLYFQAGIFGEEETLQFKRTNYMLFAACPFTCCFITGYFFGLNPLMLVVANLIGILLGRIVEDRRLRSRRKRRDEEIGYYLPLVIEQISIGVSSSLDVGPCLAYVVDMADERGSHNPVTELLAHVMKLIRAGMSLDEALTEVGTISGNGSIKNSFMFLAQCSRYGGEISKQLRELAAGVTQDRQIQIETLINGLPNKATGALGVVFAGVFVMLLTALFTRIGQAL